MIKELTKTFIANLGFEIRRNNSIKRNKLKAFGVPREEWESRGKGYYLKCLNILLQSNSSPLLDGYEYAKRIVQFGKGKFFFDDQNLLKLKINDVNFQINHLDELFVIHEVFVQGDYNFKTLEKIILIDIGQNIGATSLFFARQNNVSKIYAYELFPQTHQACLKNMKLNDSSKILSYNFGLGKNSREATIAYSPQGKAIMGLHGLPGNSTYSDVSNETVVIKDASEEFRRIDRLEPGIKKVCKMDCEGAEFEILETLFQTQAIATVDIYIIEWHGKDTIMIEQQFLEHGFEFLKTTLKDTGLIYAFKNRTNSLSSILN